MHLKACIITVKRGDNMNKEFKKRMNWIEMKDEMLEIAGMKNVFVDADYFPQGYSIIIYNNDTSSFDDVAEAIQHICGAEYKSAYLMTESVDEYGYEVVHHSNDNTCLDIMVRQFNARGIQSELFYQEI